MTATVAPEDATDKNVTWSSSDSSIASVDASGVVTGVELGSAIITVTTRDGGKSDVCVVTVIEDPTLLVLSVDKTTIAPNGTDAATFTVTQDKKDVTDKVQICMPSGMCLMSNTFSTTTEGEYEFYAYFTSDPEKTSNRVTVTAKEGAVFDASKTLHKNVAFFTFTATWCGPCYYFKSEMKTFLQTYGDKAVAVNIYTPDSETEVHSANDLYQLFGAKLYADGYDMGSIPSTFADLSKTDKIIGARGNAAYIAHIEAPYNSRMEDPTKTGIYVESTTSGGKVNLKVSVGAKVADQYQIGVLLVEDNIVAYQNGGGNNYNHIGVARNSASNNVYGESLGTIKKGEIVVKEYSFDISNYQASNLWIMVYTLYDMGFGQWLVDNSVKAPIEGVTDFKYAE
jgi:thiol-disulfide isomerase/thioredoxin